MAHSGRIDTHFHFIPPAYRTYLQKHNVAGTDGSTLPEWSRDAALAFMDSHSITAGIVSLSTPGVHLGSDAPARQAARAANEAAAELAQDRPDRFGFFASLTLPDVDGAIAEAQYAFDTLHADGVVLMANAAGQYLGDACFAPLLEELNRRSAVVFVHPMGLPCPAIPGIPTFAADFLLDTTRAAIGLAHSGALTRFPNLKIILAHAGGFVPYAAYRMAPICSETGSAPEGIAALKHFYFDVALSSTPSALPSLMAFAQPGHVTYGSDWPYAPTAVIEGFAHQMAHFPLTADERLSLKRTAAEKLFPRFASRP